jgi:hypothetical protein
LDAHTFSPSQRHDVAVDFGALHIAALRARTVELRHQASPVPVELTSAPALPRLLGPGLPVDE